MFKPIENAYLNLNEEMYPNDYANLTRIQDGMIDFPQRTTFLSINEKEKLKEDVLVAYENVCFITFIDGVYSLILNMDLKANVKKHEFVIPDVVTGMVLNYQHYNTEAAPISVLVKETIDFKGIIMDHEADAITLYNNGVVYVYVDDKADLLINSINHIESCYLADGHHRFLACQHILDKKTVLTMVTNLEDASISSIKRSMALQEPFSDSIKYLDGEGFVECEGPLKPGIIELKYQDQLKYYRLQSMNQDIFGNHDVYRLHTQIISQGFKQYDSSQMTYGDFVKEDHVCFNTYPMSFEDLIRFSDLGVVLPPKSTSIRPKSPSLLVMSLFSLET